MPSPVVFLDSSGLLGLLHDKDEMHSAAKRAMNECAANRATFVTTEWVLSEFLAGASSPHVRERACDAVRRLNDSAAVNVIQADHESWTRAFELYAQRLDKGWSHVDCTSILICQARGIGEVFSADRHFEQAGFRILLAR